ncbi:MAG: rod shape-determining protein RodA [Saprospiraceae bacterium]
MATSKQTTIQFGEIDRPLLLLYTILVVVGWLMIYAATYDPNTPFAFFDLAHTAGKQLFFILLCFTMIFVIMMVEWAFWRTFALVIYLISILILPGTLLFGREINGAHAWYQIGGFSIQPSELAKFGTCLAMAGYLSSTGVNLREWPSRLVAFGIFLLPVAMVILQEDVGSALVFFSFMLVLYREGLASVWYSLGFGAAAMVILGLLFEPPYVVAALILVLSFQLISRFRERTRIWWTLWAAFIPLVFWWPTVFRWLLTTFHQDPQLYPHPALWLLVPCGVLLLATFLPNYLRKNNMIQSQLRTWALLLAVSAGLVFAANFACYTLLAPHQQQRIKIWLNPSEASANARGSAYNLLHSQMAIGSGGLFGKGYLSGNMTKLKYVPKQSTDYIFCTVGEEQGFIGVVAIIALFALLLYRITLIAERQRSNFSRIYAYGVVGIIFTHFVVNIGMTMNVFPTIGIPLPFISYGGSSLIGFSLMIGVLLKLDSNRNLA